MRIIEGLSIHRLATGDIYSKLGITSEELKDELFIFLKLPQPDAHFLNSTINVILKEILITVNRQFISQNEGNGQYYLDLKKDIDFDAIIEDRARSLEDDSLDTYYYEILKHLTEKVNSSTYITGFNIWEHEVEWHNRKTTRKGYLFFCSPDQRSTTQPPRDFYLYFMAPYTKSNTKLL